ncbi:MAG: tRNA (adenosine(37)-N6)-threonylcarbamoyltransferase complex ATPase subunit type 1 TsaE [Thermoleophilaceae bacterium]
MHRSTAPAPVSGRRTSSSADETRALGSRLGVAAVPGSFVALSGPLGAGKTQLAKGLAEGLGVTGVVNSPTFVLMNEHAGRLRLFHVDAYRLGEPEEAIAAGLLDDRQASGVTVLEWADRLDGWLPDERLDITLSLDPASEDRRLVAWEARGALHERLAREALGAS